MAKTAHSIAYQTDTALWSSTCAARHLSLADLNEIREHAIAEPDESDSLVVHFIILSLRKPACQPLAREGRQLHAP